MTSPAAEFQDPATVARLLAGPTWAVVGLSDNDSRTAYRIATFLQERGKRIVPVHPSATSRPLFVHGEQGYPTLADIPFPVDVVDVFVRSELAGAIVDEALALGVRGIWLQLGVVDEAAFGRARATGVDIVMDTCPAIEWPAR